MTIDQRLEFLLQSTESLHANASEQASRIQNLVHAVEIDAENIRRLANIAASHDDRLETLEERLDRLEKRQQ